MEVHKQYDLMRKGNIDNSNDKNTSTAVKKNTKTQPKKTAEKTKSTSKIEIEIRTLEEKTIKTDKEIMTSKLDLPSNKNT